jgi:hypothetical protein
MTSTSDLEPGKQELLSKVVAAQVKAGHPDGPETVTVEVQLSQNTWEELLKIFIARKWADDEGFAAVVAAGIALFQTETVAPGENENPDEIIQGLLTRLADLEAQCETLRNRVDRLHVLEWRDLPLVRQQLGDCKALIMRLTEERGTSKAEDTRIRRRPGETGEPETHQ